MKCVYYPIDCPAEDDPDLNCEDCCHYNSQEPDSHNCRANDNGSGYCSVCGAIIPGTLADYEEHGYDPPESVRY